MNQITDMHCHILPGLDDGSKSMEETMEALREASRQGITSVIATPHYYPGRYEPDAGEVLHAWRQVKQRISLEGLPLRTLSRAGVLLLFRPAGAARGGRGAHPRAQPLRAGGV